MDMNKLAPVLADKGVTLQIEHPVTGKVIKGMTVTVLGMDSEKYQKIQRDKMQKTIDRQAENRGKPVQVSAEEVAQAGMRDLAEMTVGWTGIEFGKETYEFSVDNAFKLYTDHKFKWLVSQIDRFVSDRANFFES